MFSESPRITADNKPQKNPNDHDHYSLQFIIALPIGIQFVF